jgi:hypothetical protein
MGEKKKEHIKAEIRDLHPKGGPGCLWSHENGFGDYKDTDCNYRKTGYQIMGTPARVGMYNKSQHRSNAVDAGYAKWVDTRFCRLGGRGQLFDVELKDAVQLRKPGNLASFRKTFRRRYRDPISWLELDPKGWHHGFNNNQKPDRRGRNGSAFEPTERDKTTSRGAEFPYSHQYHHLIPSAPFDTYVITQENRDKRIKALLATRWNLNKGENIVCLPTELWTSAIVELPAHCPWWTRDHPEYSGAIVEVLERLGRKVTDAMDSGVNCVEKIGEVTQELDQLSKDLLGYIEGLARPIRKNKAGVELGKSP